MLICAHCSSLDPSFETTSIIETHNEERRNDWAFPRNMTSMLPPYSLPAPARTLPTGDEATSNLLSFVDMACSNIKLALDKPVRSKRKVNHRKYLQKQLKRCGGSGKGAGSPPGEGRAGESQNSSGTTPLPQQPCTTAPDTARTGVSTGGTGGTAGGGAGMTGGGAGVASSGAGPRKENAHLGLQTKSLQALFDLKTLHQRCCTSDSKPKGASGQKVPFRNRNLPSSFFTEPVTHEQPTECKDSASEQYGASPTDETLDAFAGSPYSGSPGSSSSLETIIDQTDFNDILTEVTWSDPSDSQIKHCGTTSTICDTTSPLCNSTSSLTNNETASSIPEAQGILQTKYDDTFCNRREWHQNTYISQNIDLGILSTDAKFGIDNFVKFTDHSKDLQNHQQGNTFVNDQGALYTIPASSSLAPVICHQQTLDKSNLYEQDPLFMNNCMHGYDTSQFSVSAPTSLTSSSCIVGSQTSHSNFTSVQPVFSNYRESGDQGRGTNYGDIQKQLFVDTVSDRIPNSGYGGNRFSVQVGMTSSLPPFPNAFSSYPQVDSCFQDYLFNTDQLQSCYTQI